MEQYGDTRIACIMSRLAPLLALGGLLCVPGVRADALIGAANDQESLVIGVTHVHAGEQARDSADQAVLNEEAGTQLLIGYGIVRTRTLFGVPGFFTDLEVAFGAGHLGYAGPSFDPTSGLPSTITGDASGGYEMLSDAVRVRAGRTRELGAGGHLALTPYLGLTQQAWLRNSTGYTSFSGYGDAALEVGLLAQAALTRKIVLGADAAVGRTLGNMELAGHNLEWPQRATATTFSLYLDNRTFAEWHQRFEIRRATQSFGGLSPRNGLFEPRQASSTALLLEFGTEKDLLQTLFY
jgi:hypothetical protein